MSDDSVGGLPVTPPPTLRLDDEGIRASIADAVAQLDPGAKGGWITHLDRDSQGNWGVRTSAVARVSDTDKLKVDILGTVDWRQGHGWELAGGVRGQWF